MTPELTTRAGSSEAGRVRVSVGRLISIREIYRRFSRHCGDMFPAKTFDLQSAFIHLPEDSAEEAKNISRPPRDLAPVKTLDKPRRINIM